VDDNGVHSIEPTNVQQVFVLMPLNMLAGDSDKRSYDYALKSSEGKYLSIDSDGQVSCRASAMGPRQSFVFEEQGDKTWRLRTHLGTHLVISKSRRDASGFNVTTGAPVDGLANFLVRVQPRHRIVQKPGASDGQRYEKISSKALDEMAGRRLTDSEVRTLKRAHREGGLHEALLDIRQKGKSDSRS
jgi:protein FRG1